MKKPAAKPTTAPRATRPDPSAPTGARSPAKQGKGYGQLVAAISAINTQMVGRVATAANQALVLRNWIIGEWINKYRKDGADRAKYGERLFAELAKDLKKRGIRGCGERMLQQMAVFAERYREVGLVIPQSVFAELGQPAPSSDTASDVCGIGQTLTDQFPIPLQPTQLTRISWAHFLELIRIDNPWKRAFYENELLQGQWSVRQLQRQIGSLLYERMGLSKNKKAVVTRARKQEPQQTIADLLRDPYVLEFAGLADLPVYSENDLETALLDHLQRFLLELGRGFCFEARQFPMTEGRKRHRVDLVFLSPDFAVPCAARPQGARLQTRRRRTDELLPELVQGDHDAARRPTPGGYPALQRFGQHGGGIRDRRNGPKSFCFPLPHRPSQRGAVEGFPPSGPSQPRSPNPI